MDTNQPVERSAPEQVQPVVPPAPATPPVTTTSNPGTGLGIASIIIGFFGAFFLWVIGLPLGIASIVKSNKANASPILGIIGTVLNVLAIGFSILTVLWIVGVVSSVQHKASTQSQQSTSTSSSSAADIPLSETYAMSDGGNAFWVFPSRSSWTMKTIDEKGYNIMQADDGHAQFTSYQGNESMAAASDASMTSEGLTTFVEASKGTKEGGQGTIEFEQLSDSKTVEFATQQYTYTNTSGKAMKAIIALRIYDGGHSLYVNYSATADTFSLSEWKELAGKMQVNDGVL